MNLYLTAVIFLLFYIFFTGMEIAYISANRIHIEIEKRKNSIVSFVLNKITHKPSKFIATMLLGSIFSLLLYTFTVSSIIAENYPAFSGMSVAGYFIAVVLIVIVAIIPKSFFKIFSNQLLKIFALPAYLFYILFSVITEAIVAFSQLVSKKIYNTEADLLQINLSKSDLGNYISEQIEANDQETVDSEIQIFQNALYFSEIKAREVMTPRTEITALDIESTLSQLKETFEKTGYSKILIYRDNLDSVLGYVHSFELFKNPKKIDDILISVVYVPETMPAKQVLNQLIKKHKNIAVVIDEFGGTSGMMTIEDIVEELFGEIEDEHDTVDLKEEKLSDSSYRFSARLEVDYINETYKLGLPESETYETLGGMILHYAEEIPNKGEIIKIKDYKIKILHVSETKIDEIQIDIS